jgi:hypothetical protein
MGRAQFDALSNALSSIPESTPEFDLAQRCLQKLRLWHAELYYQFFPPGTFASWKGPAKIASYSRALASVDEKPIWQSISQSVSIYRVSIVGWRYVDVVKLTVLPDGTGEIVEKPRRHGIPSCPSPTHGIVSKDQVVAFTQKLDQASFWTMPAEDRARGADGSDSVLESVQNGKYHLVDRWSPMHTDFGDLVTALFDLAAKNPGDC